MEVKEAVKTAKGHIFELYETENISDLGLEEVELERFSGNWKITIGFYRPWDHRNKLITALGEEYPARSYKVVCINDKDGRVISVTDRVLPASK